MTRIAQTTFILPIVLGSSLLGGCRSTPEPEPVYIPPPVIKTCFERTELNLVTVPARTETFIAITEIPNPPYDPIQRREEQVRVVEESYTRFEDNAGNVVAADKICDNDLVSEPVSGQDGFLPQGGRDLTQ